MPKSITIIGAIRNGGRYIDRIFQNILQITTDHFSTYQILIYENDSTDNTRELLLNYQQTILPNHLTLILENHLDKRFPYRTQRLAYIRNRLMTEALTNPKFAQSDYLLILDMDDVNGDTTDIADTFHNIFDFSDNGIWDVQTVHQRELYYDTWALRKRGLIEHDCWEQFRKDRDAKKWKDRMECYRENVEKYQKPFGLTKGLIPVISAFGGAAIYKMDRLRQVYTQAKEIGSLYYFPHYNGILQDQSGETCEHVSFHESLVRDHGFRIFINPLWINGD